MGKSGFNEVVGSIEGEDLFGTRGRDKILGDDGNDTIDGKDGADLLLGQAGRDTFVISLGKDNIKGGAGIDTIDASDFKFGVYINLFSYGYTDYSSTSPTAGLKVDGGTLKLGGLGPHDGWTVQKVDSIERFIGSAHDDLFEAVSASGRINMGKGDDKITLLEGINTLVGGAGDDNLSLGEGGKAIGGAGNDTIGGADRFHKAILLGGKGNDLIYVSAQDIAKGGAGNDRLYVSDSNINTKLFGGSGSDVFDFGYYQSGTIEDFEIGFDKADISAHVAAANATWGELSTMIAEGERGARLTFDFDHGLRGQYVEFVGLAVNEISESDFILV